MCDDHKPRSSGSPCDRCSHVFPRPSCTPTADAPFLDVELDVQSWSWLKPEYCSLFSLVVWDLHLFTSDTFLPSSPQRFHHIPIISINISTFIITNYHPILIITKIVVAVIKIKIIIKISKISGQGAIYIFPQMWMNMFAPWLSLHEVQVSICYLNITVVDLCLWMLRFVGRYFEFINIIFFFITCLFLHMT